LASAFGGRSAGAALAAACRMVVMLMGAGDVSTANSGVARISRSQGRGTSGAHGDARGELHYDRIRSHRCSIVHLIGLCGPMWRHVLRLRHQHCSTGAGRQTDMVLYCVGMPRNQLPCRVPDLIVVWTVVCSVHNRFAFAFWGFAVRRLDTAMCELFIFVTVYVKFRD